MVYRTRALIFPCNPCPRGRVILFARTQALVFLALLSVTLASGHAIARDVSGAWESLWENRVDEAIRLFEHAVEDSSNDLSARRGLALAHFARGYERRAIDSVIELSKRKNAGFLDYLLSMWIYRNTLTHGKDEEEFQKIGERMVKRRQIGSVERRVILDGTGRFAILNGDVAQARRVARSLNRIRTWSVLGPFDNTSGSGHSKDHLSTSTFDLDREYTGKAGQRFRWQNPAVLGLLGDLDFDDYFERSQAITAYAGARLEVSEPDRYLLSVSKTGSLTLRLNGTTVFDIDEESEQNELYHFDVDLPAGSHSLFAKISSREGSPSLEVSLSAVDGGPPVGVDFHALVPGSLRTDPIVFREHPIPTVRRLERERSPDAADPTAAYWRLVLLSLFRRTEEGRGIAAALAERFGSSALIRHAAATVLLHAGDAEGWKSQMKRALEEDPRNGPAALWRAEDLIRRKLFSEADSSLLALTARAPDFLQAEVTLLTSYHDRNLVEETVAKAEDLRRRFPDLAIPYRILADHYENFDPGRARSLRHQATRRSSHIEDLASGILESIQKQDLASQIKIFGKLAELHPSAPGFRVRLASAKLQRGDSDAIQVVREAAHLFPYSYEAQLLRAVVAELLMPHFPEEKEVAITHYERALALRPGDFDTRDKLRRLKSLKPVSEILPSIDLEKRRSRQVPEFPGAPACVLTDERRRILFQDGSTFAERALLIKILTAKGVQSFGSIQTGINPLFNDLTILSARTLKEDGGEIDAQTLLGNVAFQSVAPGDLIELHYRTSSWSLGKLNQEYWDSHVFQWAIPCLKSRYLLLAPPEKTFQWKLHNYDDPSEVLQLQDFGDFVLYTWELHDLAGRRADVNSPPSRDVSPWLDISTVDNWKQIVDWYGELSEEPSKSDPKVERMVAELLGDEKDRRRQVVRLYDFVANQVAYKDLSFQYSAIIPEPAPEVLRSRYGDCKDQVCLLRSMLGGIGIDSYFALVSPFSDGLRSRLPSPRFSHAILAIPEGEEYWFLDPTASGVPATELPEALQGVPSLVVRPGTTELTATPYRPSEYPGLSVTARAGFAGGEDMIVSRREVFRAGDDIARLRSAYGGADEDQRTQLLTQQLGRAHVGLELTGVQWSGLVPGSDSVQVRYDARLHRAVTRSGNLRLVKLPWRSDMGVTFSIVVASPDRREPLLLHGLHLDEHESLQVELPRRWRLQGTLEPMDLENPHGTFSLEYEISGGLLNARRVLEIQGGPVPPEDYPEFKRFLEDVIRAQGLVLVFTATG